MFKVCNKYIVKNAYECMGEHFKDTYEYSPDELGSGRLQRCQLQAESNIKG